MTALARHRRAGLLIALMAGVVLGGCASKPSPRASSPTSASSKPAGPTSARPGAYYKDDGPAASVPADLDRLPDAQPRNEPLHRFANRPYSVFGVDYTPLTALMPLQQRGIASWYGRKFHGQKTAIGEVYDMFAMTAAHPTAPLPSFARVRHVRSGRSVIVRINDRGPFHAGRIVDLSYAAAHRLGIAQGGSGEVEFELLLPPFNNLPAPTPLPPPVVIATAPPPAPAAIAIEPAPAAVALVEPAPLPAASGADNGFYVQLAAFGNFSNAQVFQQRMSAELGTVPRVQQIDSLFRVRLGPFATRAAAEAARDQAQAVLATNLMIIPPTAR